MQKDMLQSEGMYNTYNTMQYSTSKEANPKPILVEEQFKMPVTYDDKGRFLIRIGNNCCSPCVVQQQPIQLPCFSFYPMQIPCFQTQSQKKPKKKVQSSAELEHLRMRIRELESREPEVRVIKEVVKDQEQIMKLEKELQMARFQIEQEQEKSKQKDIYIFELKAQVEKNDMSRSSSLQILQKQLVERERQITLQDAEIVKLRGIIEELQMQLDESLRKIDDMEQTHSEVSVEKITYLSRELDTWKQRFIQLNRDFHANQEKLLLTEAELESIKKGDVREVKEITVERKNQSGRVLDVQTQQYETRRSQYRNE